jgi:archaellum biogenesis protein FlaJ (TadC family)
MSAWEFIGWMIAIPMAFFTVLFVIAVIVAAVRATARGVNNQTAKVTPITKAAKR